MAAKSDEKWLVLSPDQPAAKSAKAALKSRLAIVVAYLDAVANEPAYDPETVHKMRVAARRTVAVISAFAACLPKGKRRSAKNPVRDLRRTAGDARDWDVFLDSVGADTRWKDGPASAARAYVLGYAAGRRTDAREKLRDACRDSKPLVRAVDAARKSAKAPRLSTGELGAAALRELFDAIELALSPRPRTPGEFHRLRIAGKRLRYAIEVFADCFDPALRTMIYPLTVDGQQLLGRVQDAHVAADRLTAIDAALPESVSDEIRPGLNEIVQSLRSDATVGNRELDDWAERWRQMRDAHPLDRMLAPTSRDG